MRLVLLVVLLLAGCGTPLTSFTPPPLDYSGRLPLRLAVSDVRIDRQQRPAGIATAAEYQLPISLAEATEALLRQRLQPAGGKAKLVAVIEQATVSEQALPTTGGVRGYFTKEADQRLTGTLKVRVDRLDYSGNVESSVSTTATRTASLEEGTSYGERQRKGHELVLALVDDIDKGLEQQIRGEFGDLVR